MENKKLTYVTVVNKNYLPILEKLIHTHQIFSRIKLTVFTINFEYNNNKYDNVEFVEYIDENILEYEDKGINQHIKNEYEKYKYTTLLKPKIIKNFLNKSKYFFFVDCDILFTKNSDTLFINSINEFGDTKIPVSTKFFYQFCNHGNNEVIIDSNGDFNIKSLTYLPICELYQTKPNIIDYVSTYCMYYTNECYDFLDEVNNICFNRDLTTNYDYYLPLGDETVFNYLYSKYSFTKYISSFLCYDVAFFVKMDVVIENLKKLNNIVSFIHTKRYYNGNNYSDGLNNDEYEKIIDVLCETHNTSPITKITNYVKDILNDCEKIFFTINIENQDDYYVKIISLFRPDKEPFYHLKLQKDVGYFIIKKTDKYIKDLHLIIYKNKKIIDCVKV